MAIDNSLLGKYDKEDSKVKRAVYRVKNSDNDDYTRIHFETSSQMIHDATNNATANKVARRDSSGSIKFKNIEAGGLTKTNTLEVISTSALKGATTVGSSVADNSVALTVSANKDTSLGGNLGVSKILTVTGASNFTGKTTHSNGSEIVNGLKVTSGGADISGTLTARSNISALSDVAVNGNTTLGTPDHKKTTTINGVAKINKLEVTDANVVTNLNADRVDNCHVSDTSATTSNLWTASKTNTTKADKSITITATDGLNGNGTLASNIVIKHNTKNVSQTPATTKSFTTVKSLSFDGYGHLNSVVETDLDERYPLKTNTIKGENGLGGGDALGTSSTIYHLNVTRTNSTPALDTSGTACNVIKSIGSNSHGHITSAETIDIDKRYPKKTISIGAGTGLNGGGTLEANRTISHDNIGRNSSVVTSFGTGGTTCPVLKSIASNGQGHITASEEVDLDKRYPNRLINISGTNGLTGGGTLEANRSISHGNVGRTNTTTPINTAGTTCNVLRGVGSNGHGHITSAETVNLDDRYYTKDLTNQQIENKVNNVVGNDVILKNPTSGTANGKNLKMEGFTMQFNATTKAIEFVFV